MWFIGVEVEQETSAPPPKKYPGSAPGLYRFCRAKTSKDYRSYDADKKLQQKISSLSEVGLFKKAL